MKKILTSVVAMLLAVPTFAQMGSGGFTADADNVYYGLRIGFTAASISGEKVMPVANNWGFLDSDLGVKTGLSIGGVVGLRVSNNVPVFLESGLYYSERGGKSDGIKANYINFEIPLLIKYGFNVQDDFSIIPYFGPVFSYAVSGKTKQPDGSTGKEKVGTFDEKKAITGGLRRPNFGLKLGCGFEYNMLYAELGYQFGVSNIAKYDDMTAHSNAFFANFGLNF